MKQVVKINANLDGLSQPVTKLIEVVAQGIGTVYKPMGTVLMAIAEAKSQLVLAKGDMAKHELLQRAATRLAHTEIQRQKNIDAIVEKAHSELPNQVSSEPVNQDWITHFFDAAKDVSDSDMQSLWARILAGEVAQPETTSRRTLEFLKTLSKKEAEMFVVLLSVSFSLHPNKWRFIILDKATTEKIMEASGGVEIISHMADIGILGSESTMVDMTMTGDWRFDYGSETYRFNVPIRPNIISEYPTLPGKLFSIHLFSAIGQELSAVAAQTVQTGFIEKLSRSLKSEVDMSLEKIDEKK